MPPPQLSLADGATVQIDGVNIVSRSGNNVTFDNTTVSSVWDFKNAQSVTAAIQIQNNNFYDYDISTSAGKNYKVMLNVDGSGGIKVEFFEMQVGGGGAPAGGPGGPGGGMMTMLMGGDKLCVDGPNAFPSASSCQSPSTELLNLSSTGLITLATGWAVESGGDDPNHALSSGSRQLGSNDGFAKYKLQNSSTKQKLEVEIGSPFTYDNKWDVEIMVMPPAMHQAGVMVVLG